MVHPAVDPKRNPPTAEVDFKLKSGNAWSHNFLNQKHWHPLSYPNQKRKWIAEQKHAQHARANDTISKEFNQEQDFFRNSALMSSKEKERIEAMQAVSFMYTKPPGYNAESARAAEIADEQKALQGSEAVASLDGPDNATEDAPPPEALLLEVEAGMKRKRRAKDVFGRTIATAEEFPQLVNAPKEDTGIAGRPKPFGVEFRNVRCAKCGVMGHQSGDRECVRKDDLTPLEMARQKREDPLTHIMANTGDEPLRWELKQHPSGFSPARGGFGADDPNQQILADEEAGFDEYGGFLGADEAYEGGGAISSRVLSALSEKERKALTKAFRVREKSRKKEREKERMSRRKEKREKKQRGIIGEDGKVRKKKGGRERSLSRESSGAEHRDKMGSDRREGKREEMRRGEGRGGGVNDRNEGAPDQRRAGVREERSKERDVDEELHSRSSDEDRHQKGGDKGRRDGRRNQNTHT